MSVKIGISKEEEKGLYMIRGDKIFRRVKNAEATDALEYGQAVFYKHGKSDEVIACDTSATGLPSYAGVVQAADDADNEDYSILAGEWGTILIHGEGQAILDGDDDIAIGDALKGVHDEDHMVKDQAAGTEALYFSHAIALEAYTVNDDALKKVFVRAKG